MGMFLRDDPHIDEKERQTGFCRYRQLLDSRFSRWWKINLLTLAGLAPLAAGIFWAVASTSLLALLPCSILGGMVAGPFLAGMYDALLRGMRDDPLPWRDAYARAWRQNWKGSLLPGGLTGLLAGLYAFMGMLLWTAETPPSAGTAALGLFSLLLALAVSGLYWPQLVLFDQRAGVRLRNCMLFCVRYFWRVMGAGLLHLGYWAVLLLFAPWTLLLLPVTGVWYILFLTQFLLYRQMDEAFRIEERFAAR
ncbi:MAG: hypothetical protein K2O45_17960 [Oscillospiraceae bacterium]|nr:hypothetical protein [Oscillospiraceae bacterium]